MPTFHLLNFGCRASQADGAALKRQLQELGLEEVARVDQSQIAVLNTCTVTAQADTDVRQAIRRIHRENPSCRILVTGCYAQRAPREIAELPGVTWVVGNSHKHTVAELLRANLRGVGAGTHPCEQPTAHVQGLVQIQKRDAMPGEANTDALAANSGLSADHPPAQILVGEISDEFHFAPVFPDDRTRPTVKIQDGCNARCAFCIIPSVRGRSRSLAPEKVIEQILALEQCGYREIVLSGINLGSYGRDLDRRLTFLGLVERILLETPIARVRISSIEPMDVSSELILLAAQEARLADHFHIPLQSGCDRILRQMNRRYWTKQYADRVLAIREAIPNCGIGADVMVGFPGETDEDHSTSARFIASLPFTYLHVFPYSPRPTTPAAARPGQVDGRRIHERGREIRSLIAMKRQAFLAAQVGRRLSALTLDEADEGACMALTSNFLKIALPRSHIARNKLLNVRVGRADAALLYGYPET